MPNTNKTFAEWNLLNCRPDPIFDGLAAFAVMWNVTCPKIARGLVFFPSRTEQF